MAGRLGGINFLLGCLSVVVGVNVEAVLVEDLGVDTEETVNALNDMVNDLGGRWRKASIPCCNKERAMSLLRTT